jgi:ribosomal protein S12 methylthiotransferase
MIALGCAKNMVDAEIMLGTLMKEGVEITNQAAEADVVIVNTCSFIDAAQEESVDTILESNALRQAHHQGQALVVTGCLPQRFREDLPKLLPEVDAFMGIDEVTQIGRIVRQAMSHRAARLKSVGRPAGSQHSGAAGKASSKAAQRASKAKAPSAAERSEEAPAPSEAPAPLVNVQVRPSFVPDYSVPRFRLTPRHFAYVKIAEGCNHPCSFCIIPRIRGSHRSRPLADLLQECRQLLADGVKELNLISQDSTYYGLDLRPERRGPIAAPDRFSAAAKALPRDHPTLSLLLRALQDLPGDFWIRILYTHPAHWTDELIETLSACPKVARYVDIPLQHIHDSMLARMRRETSKDYVLDLLRRLRAALPGIALRTTFIVGFPGETEACFQELLAFIREAKFERLGVFTYSQEQGTIAAKMAGQTSDRVKQRRRELAMAAQHEVARQVAASFVGRTLKVLVEGPAATKDLQAASVFSWEHGLVRDPDTTPGRGEADGARVGKHRLARDAQSAFTLEEGGNYSVARGEADAPDIDGRVFVRGRLDPGRFARVKVIGHTDYDLIAEPV